MAAPVIVFSPFQFFNQSIRTGIFPYECKIAKITSIYKSGPQRPDMPNYRPIFMISRDVTRTLIWGGGWGVYSYVHTSSFSNQIQIDRFEKKLVGQDMNT